MVRIKHRYLLVNILYPDTTSTTLKPGAKSTEDLPYSVRFRQPSPDSFNGKIFTRMLRDAVADLFGDYGAGKIAGSLQLKYFSPATSTAIVRVSRDHYRLVWAALTYTTRIPKPVDRKCVFQVVRVSGTIKKAEEEAIRRARWSIRRAQRSAGIALNGHVDNGATVAGAVDEYEDGDVGMANGIEDADEGGDDDDGDGDDD